MGLCPGPAPPGTHIHTYTHTPPCRLGALPRAGEGELKGLDSSMKRNTALLRKLRQLGEDTRASLLEEVAKVNQSKVGAGGSGVQWGGPLCWVLRPSPHTYG